MTAGAEEERLAGDPRTVDALGERGVVPQRLFGARVWGGFLGLWGAVAGLAPHVLHHVGPLAGAAFLAGAGGQLLFAGIAIAVSIPFLLRIYHRFGSWVAPAIAIVVMAGMFLLSTLVIGPAITDGDRGDNQPQIERTEVDEHGH